MGTMSQEVYKKSVYIIKRAIRYVPGLKQTDSRQRSFIRLKILTLYSLYTFETILFVREKGIVRQTIHSHNTKSFLNYHQSAHNLKIYNCRPTIAGGKFYNRLPAHTKLIKDNLLFRRHLKQLLIKGCYYSVEEYMCDDFT
jgi:hypothetical protein